MDRNSLDNFTNSLISKLRERQPSSPFSSVAHTEILNDLQILTDLRYLLSIENDYDKVAEQLIDAPDIKNLLLEFIVCLIRKRFVWEPDVYRRARQLMFKIVSSTPTMPSFLFLSDLTISSNLNAERLFRGEHKRKAVVLEPLYRTRNNVDQDFSREALVTWLSLPDDFVLRFLGIYENEASQLFLVVPYMINDTLARWRKKQSPSATAVKRQLCQVAEGLRHMHSHGIVHGDICGANVLLDEHFSVKISGFGLTRHSEHVVTGYGSLHENFAAPELFVNSDGPESESATTTTEESDIYAFGCLYYEIYYDAVPFEGKEYVEIMRAVTHGERPPRRINPPMSDEEWDLINSCWMESRQQRPRAMYIAVKLRPAPESGVATVQSFSLRESTAYVQSNAFDPRARDSDFGDLTSFSPSRSDTFDPRVARDAPDSRVVALNQLTIESRADFEYFIPSGPSGSASALIKDVMNFLKLKITALSALAASCSRPAASAETSAEITALGRMRNLSQLVPETNSIAMPAATSVASPTTSVVGSTDKVHRQQHADAQSFPSVQPFVDFRLQTTYEDMSVVMRQPDSLLPLHEPRPLPALPDLRTLLVLLRKEPIAPLGSNVNQIMVDLMRKLLALPDYSTIISDLGNPSDVERLIDLILYLLDNDHLQTPESSRQARRLIFKLLVRTPVTPTSLFITGVEAELTLHNIIGMGGFGYVYKGEYKAEQVALKVMYKKSHQNDFCREALVWRSLSHSYILPLLGIFEVESQLFLVSPYMKNGTLDVWRGNKQLEPGVDEIRMRILEVASGVQYIHSEGIVHGDLRGANVLLDAEFHAQIADFGLTIHADMTATGSTTGLTLRFAAPELFGVCNQQESDRSSEDDKQKSKKTHETDTYAFGCLYFEIYFNTMPFAKINDHAVMWSIINGKRPQRLDNPTMEDAEWDLVQLCWDHNPVSRPKMEDVVERISRYVNQL